MDDADIKEAKSESVTDLPVTNGSLLKSDEDSVPPNYGDGIPPELLWITEGSNEVLVTIYAYKEQSGKLRSFSLDVSPILRELDLIEFPIESRWSVPDRTQLSDYREKSSRLDARGIRVMVDRNIIQNFIIRNHLKEIKFGSKVLDLPRDRKNSLTPDALKILGKLHPTIMDMLFLKYTDEAALIL